LPLLIATKASLTRLERKGGAIGVTEDKDRAPRQLPTRHV
jgi:hypothetical protein